jgi:hypothetical protein
MTIINKNILRHGIRVLRLRKERLGRDRVMVEAVEGASGEMIRRQRMILDEVTNLKI